MNIRPSLMILLASTSLLLSACEPEVGSEAWCDQMDEKPKADWSLNDAGSYAKHCVFRKKDEEEPAGTPD